MTGHFQAIFRGAAVQKGRDDDNIVITVQHGSLADDTLFMMVMGEIESETIMAASRCTKTGKNVYCLGRTNLQHSSAPADIELKQALNL